VVDAEYSVALARQIAREVSLLLAIASGVEYGSQAGSGVYRGGGARAGWASGDVGWMARKSAVMLC
jgi:hypothetical protein